MILATLAESDDFEAWRDVARGLVAGAIPPDTIVWRDGDESGDLFARPGTPPTQPPPPQRPVRASRPYLDLARSALLHRDPARLDVLYRVLWRLQEDARALDDAADRDVLALRAFARDVRRDVHKMRAFVRFRRVDEAEGGECFVSWFEPEHRIERYNAKFFVDRFTNQRWSILTPRVSLHWDGARLGEGPGAARADAPTDDGIEELWRAYYRSIFNPARLKTGAMLKEMPRKYWKNLPEAREIRDLVAGAQRREAAMIATGSELFTESPPASLGAMAEGIAQCTRCPIGCNGTRAVMGEGPPRAGLMIVGEQPGDVEEQVGRPFVGPAGSLLDDHLRAAGIERSTSYVTNAVKHFKFTLRGKRRLHQSPSAHEIDTCRWWLEAERALVRPKLILALGASAGRGLLGRTPAIGKERGQPKTLPDGTPLWLTAHPSYLLRLDGEARQREGQRFADDLAAVAAHLA